MTRRRCVRTDAVRVSGVVALLLTALAAAGCGQSKHEPAPPPPPPAATARVATLRVGLPSPGRANLLFTCDVGPTTPHIGSASYAADTLDASGRRWLRMQQE